MKVIVLTTGGTSDSTLHRRTLAEVPLTPVLLHRLHASLDHHLSGGAYVVNFFCSSVCIRDGVAVKCDVVPLLYAVLVTR